MLQGKQKYNDVRIFIPAIAFISAFNYYLTYSNIKLNGFLLLTYTIDTVQGWLAWWAVRSIIIWLDNTMPYTDRPLKRILVQTLLTTTAGLSVIILLTELVNAIARDTPLPASFYLFDIFIFIIWFLVINGIYIGMHYYQEWKQAEQLRQEEKQLRSGGFTVKQGRQNLVIPFKDIMAFYSEDGYTILLTWDQKKYFPDFSLDKTATQLPGEWFFRINRQVILHRNAISGYTRSGEGRLDILIPNAGKLPTPIQVSHTRAAAFKNWFQP